MSANPQPTNPALLRTGPNLAAGTTCLHCGRSDGQLLLFSDTRRRSQFGGDWTGYPLHEKVCADAWLREHELYDERSRGNWAASRPKMSNVVKLITPEMGIANIEEEIGLDHEHATWLYYFRNGCGFREDPKQIFCETFEQKLAAATAERLLREPKPALTPIPLTFFADLADTPTPRPWLIKNVIARDETSSWIAPPGKGKSALLTDIAVHTAAGKDWRGRRVKECSGVVYFALERADLVRRRLAAYKLRDSLGALPIAVTGQMIDLLDRRCVDQILAAIRDAEQHFDCAVGLVIFDTYSKGIAAGGGDEDKAKDQNVVQANLRRLFDRDCHVHIAGVGHTGKDESRGERGSNARLADVDMQVQITGDIIKIASITKANDQPEGVLTGFKLEPFDFGADEDGDPFRTFIIGPELYSAEQGISRQRPSDKQMLALRALAEVVLSQGRRPPPGLWPAAGHQGRRRRRLARRTLPAQRARPRSPQSSRQISGASQPARRPLPDRRPGRYRVACAPHLAWAYAYATQLP